MILFRAGESERQLIKAEPNRTARLEIAEVGAAGCRNDFYQYGRTNQIYLRAGIVNRACRVQGRWKND